jgi:ribosomal protein S18 acetylase RimI-like enzyme
MTIDDIDAVRRLLGPGSAEQRLSGSGTDRDDWVASDAGRIVGHAALGHRDGAVSIWGDAAIADELLAHLAGAARERGLDRIRLAGPADDELLSRLVGCHGFELETETLLMWRRLDEPVPPPEWPAGTRVRTFEPADAAPVHAMLDEAYRAWDSRYVPLEHDDWLRWMTGDIDFDPTVWWLADRDGETVGCALHWRTGWLKDLAVRSTERRLGLGAALVQHGLAEFARRGVERVGLKVDAANPTGAVRLYERLGFVVHGREATWASNL